MKVKVKLLRPIYPYASGEIMMMDEKKVKYFKNQIEIIKEEVKEVKKVKNKKNKAILSNNNNKGL